MRKHYEAAHSCGQLTQKDTACSLAKSQEILLALRRFSNKGFKDIIEMLVGCRQVLPMPGRASDHEAQRASHGS